MVVLEEITALFSKVGLQPPSEHGSAVSHPEGGDVGEDTGRGGGSHLARRVWSQLGLIRQIRLECVYTFGDKASGLRQRKRGSWRGTSD